MDIFALREQLVEDYRLFTGSFVAPRDVRIQALLDQRLAASDQWPDPWLSLNPSFATGGTPAELAPDGTVAGGGEGMRAWFMSTPFAFCLRCRVSYEQVRGNDFSKLGRRGGGNCETLASLETKRPDWISKHLQIDRRENFYLQ